MSLPAAGLRLPRFRVLLPRTRLAYVHLRNLFTDAKRDRKARVFGYVCVWLPDDFLLFYLQEGEVVNVTASPDGQRFRQMAIADAVAMVPREAEYGEVCFHEADDEQLAMMFWSQLGDAAPWPPDVKGDDADAVLRFMRATMHDGVLEVISDEARSYAVVRAGEVVRGYFSDDVFGAPEGQLRASLSQPDRWVRVRLWPVPAALPVQAAPALIRAYRELIIGMVRRLRASGVGGAAEIAETARRNLVHKHPALDRFGVDPDPLPAAVNVTSTLSFGRTPSSATKDPICDAASLSAAIGTWIAELLWTAPPGDGTPSERFLEDMLRERRHMYQVAGLLDALPWRLFV